jgi:hypothetical protein
MQEKSELRPTTSLRGILSVGPVRLAVFAGIFVLLSIATPLVIYRQLNLDQLPTATRVITAPFVLLCALLLVVYFATDGLRLHHT